jgi:hypothetical protein
MQGELRIPSRLLSTALSGKKVKQLRLLATAKLEGHRIEINTLCECLKIHPKTGQRLVKKLVADEWAGTDGAYLFPRSWRKLKFSKRGGLYITTAPKDLRKFEALCFAKALKKLYRKPGGQHSNKGRVVQNDFPARYISKSLGLSERRFERLKASAQRYRYISVKPQVKIIGKASEFVAISKNLHGVPVFKRGKHTVVPDISKIRVLI